MISVKCTSEFVKDEIILQMRRSCTTASIEFGANIVQSSEYNILPLLYI